MNIARRLGPEGRAKLYLRLIREDVEGWRKLDAFPGPGPPDPMDVMALLVSPRLESVLKQAEQDSGEPYWERLMGIDVPVPIVMFDSMGDGLWSGLHRADAEGVFTALHENGWAPSQWSSGARN